MIFFSTHCLVLPNPDSFILRDGSIRPTLAQEENRLIRDFGFCSEVPKLSSLNHFRVVWGKSSQLWQKGAYSCCGVDVSREPVTCNQLTGSSSQLSSLLRAQLLLQSLLAWWFLLRTWVIQGAQGLRRVRKHGWQADERKVVADLRLWMLYVGKGSGCPEAQRWYPSTGRWRCMLEGWEKTSEQSLLYIFRYSLSKMKWWFQFL